MKTKHTEKYEHDKMSLITLVGVIVFIVLLIIWLTTVEFFSA